jgi:sporulation protein YlmC with PRC-barrel domain
MQQALSIERLDAMRGAPVYDSAGEKIGTVEEIFWDAETSQPEWIGIGTGFFGTKRELLSDGSVSIPLFEERLVVRKELVVRERVVIRKRTVTEEHRIEADLRSERIEVEGDVASDPGDDAA